MGQICGGEKITASLSYKSGTNRILMNVANVAHVVIDVRDAAVIVTAFPYVEFASKAKGKPTFDVLHRLLQRYIWSGS